MSAHCVCVSVILAGATPPGGYARRHSLSIYSFALRVLVTIGRRKVTKFGRYYTCFCSTRGHSLHVQAPVTRVRISPAAADADKQAALGVN
jgi:hypothetical protein